MSKFKVGDKVRVVRNNGDDFDGIKIGGTGEVVDFCNEGDYQVYLKINKYNEYGFKEEELELYKEDKMEKTFREVIADIKEGEIWGNGAKIIELINGTIQVRSKNNIPFNSCFINFSKVAKYKLQRKEYTFEEAFKAYEEGKEIESCYTATKFCENEYLENNVYSDWKLGVRFKVDEIKGKWYINEVD
jgi:hypothetical protein